MSSDSEWIDAIIIALTRYTPFDTLQPIYIFSERRLSAHKRNRLNILSHFTFEIEIVAQYLNEEHK